jgi:hypothetical protein
LMPNGGRPRKFPTMRDGACYPRYVSSLALPRFCDSCYDKISYPQRNHEEEPVATLYCPCGQAHELWAEFWWTEGRYHWVFFDHEQASETYAEQVENCPACGRRLERKHLLS